MTWRDSLKIGDSIVEFYRREEFFVLVKHEERFVRLRIDLQENPQDDGSISYYALTRFDGEWDCGEMVDGHGSTEAEAINNSFNAFVVHPDRFEKAIVAADKRARLASLKENRTRRRRR